MRLLLWTAALLCAQQVLAVTTYGYVEKVLLFNQLEFKAKLDTGAKSASLDARNITYFNKNGKKWVRFYLPHHGEKRPLCAPYLREVKIKMRKGEMLLHHNEAARRPVVQLPITLGNSQLTIPINLTNRSNFNYHILLGRDALIAFNASVNPKLTFTTQPIINHSQKSCTEKRTYDC